MRSVERVSRKVVLKQRAGSFARIDGAIIEGGAVAVNAADMIGTGNVVAASSLAGPVWQLDLPMRLRSANAVGAYAVMNVGDYEGLPTNVERGRVVITSLHDSRD